MIKQAQKITESSTSEGQSGFRKGKGMYGSHLSTQDGS